MASLLRDPTKKELSRKFSRNCSSAQGAIPRVQTWIISAPKRELGLFSTYLFRAPTRCWGSPHPVPTKIRSPGWICWKMAISGQNFFGHRFFIASKSELLSSG